MTVMEAITPVLGLLTAGAAIVWVILHNERSKKHDNDQDALPTDPLSDLFVRDDDNI